MCLVQCLTIFKVTLNNIFAHSQLLNANPRDNHNLHHHKLETLKLRHRQISPIFVFGDSRMLKNVLRNDYKSMDFISDFTVFYIKLWDSVHAIANPNVLTNPPRTLKILTNTLVLYLEGYIILKPCTTITEYSGANIREVYIRRACFVSICVSRI